jgi:hypothetical protein
VSRSRVLGTQNGKSHVGEVDPLPWIRTFTVTVQVGDRVEWMNQVAWMLDQLPDELVEHQWQRWMRQYWEDRLDSVPVQLTLEEASAMAAWVVHLTDSIKDGVGLATRLRGQPEPVDVDAIVEEALRLGCSGAPQW